MLNLIRVGLLALLMLQAWWHGFMPPPRSAMGWTALAITVVPLAAALPGAWKARPMPLFWANIMALLFFCHGVSEAWITPEMRLPALAEMLLSVVVIAAYGAFGLKSRRLARAQAPSTSS
ncbi:DUF2069 domain-containing protein [Pseudofulvimonas gallinarii]|jgi:uncharacterized membrane protein|uniref:Putative membrane protein n=1 Tax=Pseudofulvimonas gallinarii TaxID=634155 RepID=A0A4R3LH93_9GAMM|nr:DUF2069 domain-containing protein [Pseudofulvimonas gallinarii]TCS99581.1 putative membrane protein [Pseudofulvimonas gallinarii]THD14846.1 hypothetical protein B1808_02170 [Pseudofulvimonas gallinarii]